MEKLLKENEEKVPAEEKAKVEEKLAELKKVKDGEDKAEIDRVMEETTTVSHKLAELIYQQAGAEAGPEAAPGAGPEAQQSAPGGAEGAPSDDNIKDADFEVKS